MFGHTYYHSIIRKYVALFGTLFNDIHINRPDTAHNAISTVKVPIAYGPVDKVLARITADPNLNRMPAIQLPRMSFEITDFSYATSRKLLTANKRVKVDATNPNVLKYLYNPVPYDIKFALSIIVKNADDGARIVEQILPFFTPEWTTTVLLIPEANIIVDIPIVLDTVTVKDDYEGNFEERRSVIWTLTFTLKGYIYGPVRKNEVIKFATTNTFNALQANTELTTTTVEPGLTSAGAPTTVLGDSISSTLISANSDYGFITTQTDT